MTRLIHEITFALKVARPGFWLTSIWFYLLPIAQRPVLGSYPFWLGLLYVTFPLGYLLYGANDGADVDTDRLNPRKDTFLFGARGNPLQLAKLPLRIGTVQLPFLLLFVSVAGLKMVPWFLLLCIATLLYNWPGPGAKGIPFLDLLNQAGYLLVFVLSCWLNREPQPPWYLFLFGALFAMHSHLFGQIMDYAPDRAAGRQSTAVFIGVVPAKLLLVLLLGSESSLLLKYADTPYLGLLLLGGALWFLADAFLLWKRDPYSPAQMRIFMYAWNAAALLSLPLVWTTGLDGFARN